MRTVNSREHALLRAISRSVGHVWGTKSSTPRGIGVQRHGTTGVQLRAQIMVAPEGKEGPRTRWEGITAAIQGGDWGQLCPRDASMAFFRRWPMVREATGSRQTRSSGLWPAPNFGSSSPTGCSRPSSDHHGR
jgi:hypothetical protein